MVRKDGPDREKYILNKLQEFCGTALGSYKIIHFIRNPE